jgi:NitT/TauT family transport system ATP-binding protein
VLESLNLRVEEGEFCTLVGASGCGKSTFLRLLLGQEQPSKGQLLLDGVPLAAEPDASRGVVFQRYSVFPHLTVLDNVAIGLELPAAPFLGRLFGARKRAAREAAAQMLQRVGLGASLERYPHQLSGGMRKRVALAQMLILDPQILLMDEPFSALDVQTRQLMENELLELWSANRKSVLFITHDLEEAIALSDRVVVLSAGPATRPIGEFPIDLPRPRDVAEIRLSPRFVKLHEAIWHVLKSEVLKGYAQGKR